jgi:hypothetical protein
MKFVSKMSVKAKITRPAVITEQLPSWLLKLTKQRSQKENKYKKAHRQFASIYNEFLLMIDEINAEYGTTFTIEQAMEEFHGEEADEDDEDE